MTATITPTICWSVIRSGQYSKKPIAAAYKVLGDPLPRWTLLLLRLHHPLSRRLRLVQLTLVAALAFGLSFFRAGGLLIGIDRLCLVQTHSFTPFGDLAR